MKHIPFLGLQFCCVLSLLLSHTSSMLRLIYCKLSLAYVLYVWLNLILTLNARNLKNSDSYPKTKGLSPDSYWYNITRGQIWAHGTHFEIMTSHEGNVLSYPYMSSYNQQEMENGLSRDDYRLEIVETSRSYSFMLLFNFVLHLMCQIGVLFLSYT